MTLTRARLRLSRIRRLAASLLRWCPASAASLNGQTNLRPLDLLTYIRGVRRDGVSTMRLDITVDPPTLVWLPKFPERLK